MGMGLEGAGGLPQDLHGLHPPDVGARDRRTHPEQAAGGAAPVQRPARPEDRGIHMDLFRDEMWAEVVQLNGQPKPHRLIERVVNGAASYDRYSRTFSRASRDRETMYWYQWSWSFSW